MDTRSEELRSQLICFVRGKFISRRNISDLAEDIVQQAFADVPPEKWTFPYMSAVCIHCAYRYFKRLDYEGRIQTGGDESLWFIDERDTVTELIEAQDAKEILDSLQVLKEIERIVVTQRYYGDYSFAEIALNNNMKLSTVLSHHRRALEKLRPHLAAFSQGRNKKRNAAGRNAAAKKAVHKKGGIIKMTQREIYDFGILAERAHRLAFDIAMQSGQLGEGGWGIAVVADECRTIGNKLKKAAVRLMENPADTPDMEEEIMELETLAVNGSIESLRVADKENGSHCSGQLAVIFDELRNLVSDLKNNMGRSIFPCVWLTPAPKSSVLHKRMPFLLMKINGILYTENVRLVQEVLRDFSHGRTLALRGEEIPMADVSLLPGEKTEPQFAAVLWKNFDESESFALPLDCIPTLFWSVPGICSEKEAHLRECWTCEEEQKMLFLDYTKLLRSDSASAK